MKYFIYCRKSSEEDSRQTQSLGTQQRLLIDLANKLDLEVVDIIKESKSAKTDQNRPLFSQMLARVQHGEANGILVVHTDRLARNFIDAGFIIKMIEAGTLKEVRTLSSVFNNVPSLMYMGFDFVFAAHYSRDLSEKVKAGNESKLLKGEYPTYAPIGYVNILPGKGIEPDPIRASFITRAYELFATGEYSIKTISKKLADEGFRSRTGCQMANSAIHHILTNPEYYGLIKRKDKLYAGKHKPLITKELFEQVQDILHNRGRPRKQIHNFVFRDFLFCEECGCKITAAYAKGKYIYYRCTNGKGKCNQHKKYWSKKHISEEFEKFFADFMLDPVRANASFDLYKQKMLKESNRQQNSGEAITQQIQALKKRLSKLEDMYLDGRIEVDRFDERKLEYENELAELRTLQKRKTKQDTSRTLELVENIKNQAIQLSIIFKEGDDQVKRDLIKSVLWNSGLEDGKIVSTRLTKLWQPLENLNQTEDLEKWRRGQDLNLRGS